MSLLLDALKKAADKKKENEDLSIKEADSENFLDKKELIDDDLDLDLEMDNKDEDFPLVDEVLEVEETIIDKSEDEALLLDNEQELQLNNRVTIKEEGSIERDGSASNKEVDNPENYKNEEVETADVIETYDSSKAEEKHTTSINNREENKEALSALINKSNYYTKNKKIKSKIAAAIFMLVCLTGVAAYYYIEFSSSTQDLFVTGDLSSEPVEVTAVNREKIITRKPELTVVKSPVKASFDKPVQKRVVKIKKNKIKPAIKKSINIVYKTVEDPIDVLVRQAYDAFIANDLERSNILYKKVLNRENKNRDALLGLSAIAVKQQRYEFARQKYLNLLKLDPKDSFALAGLSTISNRIDPQLNESQLKFMLREQPDAAHLYFALGSHYAAQRQWPEAQSAFFSAWSAENENADYCYNLAVSLDHLGKKNNAKDYYKLSIKLKKLKGGNFSIEDAKTRIQYIQASDS